MEVKSMYTDFAAYLAAAFYHINDYEQMWNYWDQYINRFKENIYDGRGDVQEEALKWNIAVNPYQGETKLTPFREYITANKNLAPQQKERTTTVNAEVKDAGAHFELSFNGERIS